MVVLGCAVAAIQDDRVNTAINYASDLTNDEVIWFLTGGVKNSVSNLLTTEADRMSKVIGTHSNQHDRNKIILDERAKNTAENFAYLKKWIRETYNDDIPEIVITTSEFHRERASRIFTGTFDDVSPTWNLSKSDNCDNCWRDELIHMRNVENDIQRARYILVEREGALPY